MAVGGSNEVPTVRRHGNGFTGQRRFGTEPDARDYAEGPEPRQQSEYQHARRCGELRRSEGDLFERASGASGGAVRAVARRSVDYRTERGRARRRQGEGLEAAGLSGGSLQDGGFGRPGDGRAGGTPD